MTEERKVRLPKKELTELRDKKIRDLAALNYSDEEIAGILKCSRTTVFFVLHGRSKK